MNFAQRLFKKTQKMWRGHILMGHQCSVHIQSPYASRSPVSQKNHCV